MTKLFKIILIIIACLFVFSPVLAQDSFTLSITPPLVKNNVSPGEKWKSSVKVVNNNSQEINAYVQVLDFKSGSESGTVEFIKTPKDLSEQTKHLLSGWIEIDPGPYTIGAYESRNIGFTINIPESAEPGGHYAAILTGTKPTEDKIEGSAIKISSLLGSLLLLNVNGEATESGRIREFSTDKKFYNKPDINLRVRFENTGSVHIQPQGEIRIINFLGKEKKIIPINHYTDFGNILPNSIRKWDFNWRADSSFWEMGRYRAVLELDFGEKAHESVDQTIYFWIINFKLLLITLSSVLFVFLLFLFLIKAYIRRAIKLTQKQAGIIVKNEKNNKQKISVVEDGISETELKGTVKKNIDSNFKKNEKQEMKNKELGKIKWGLFRRLLKVVIIFLIIILAIFIYFNYKENFSFIKNFFNKDKNKVEIIETKEGASKDVVFEKEEITTSTTKEKEGENSKATEATSTPEFIKSETATSTDKDAQAIYKEIKLKVLNGSGEKGAAGEAAEIIKQAGINIEGVGNADNFEYFNSIIKYKKTFLNEANQIKKLFSFQVELQEIEEQEEDIVVIVGSNYK